MSQGKSGRSLRPSLGPAVRPRTQAMPLKDLPVCSVERPWLDFPKRMRMASQFAFAGTSPEGPPALRTRKNLPTTKK